jgi:hypothetical protein
MMQALREMVSEGVSIRPEDLEFLSPYPTHNLKRFGDYKLRMDRPLESWLRDALFGRAARAADREGPAPQPG